jgi:type I restriction enzyme S subunit
MNDTSSVADLVDLVRTKKAGRKSSGERYIGLEHIASGGGLIGTAPASVSAGVNGVFEAGDVLFGKLRPNLRKSVQPGFGGYCSTDILILRPKPERSPAFVKHAITTDAVFRHAEANSIGTRMPRTSWAAVAEVPIWMPSATEQRRIAEILDTVDHAVATSERLIAKSSELRDSLLEDLIGRNFRDRAVRRVSLRQMLAAVIDFRGRTPRKLGMSWGRGDIPALSANNVQMGYIDFDRECYLASDALYRKWMTSGDVRHGDVLVTMEAPLGNIATVPDERRYVLSQRVVLLRFDPSLMLNTYGRWLMTCVPMQSEMRRRSTGTTAVGIRRSELERIEVPAVPHEEQVVAARTLDSVEAQLHSQDAALRKLRELRTAIVTDLLSGRVRTVAV